MFDPANIERIGVALLERITDEFDTSIYTHGQQDTAAQILAAAPRRLRKTRN
jgi:hypothetical protein